MPSYQIIQTFICKKLKVSKTEALNFIYLKQVYINENVAVVNDRVYAKDEVIVNNVKLQEKLKYHYYKFYKPRNIECTLNKQINDNLHTAFKVEEGYSYVGRLDKESEGLLIITNDGLYSKYITDKANSIQKIYVVETDKPINVNFKTQMENGIKILGKFTLPCSVKIISDYKFEIILTEGINRQIRRMCYKLGYEVLSLKRIKIDNISLGDLEPGEFKEFEICN